MIDDPKMSEVVTLEQGFKWIEDRFDEHVLRQALSHILRSRRKSFRFTWNLKRLYFRRDVIRDHLKAKFPDVKQAPPRNKQ